MCIRDRSTDYRQGRYREDTSIAPCTLHILSRLVFFFTVACRVIRIFSFSVFSSFYSPLLSFLFFLSFFTSYSSSPFCFHALPISLPSHLSCPSCASYSSCFSFCFGPTHPSSIFIIFALIFFLSLTHSLSLLSFFYFIIISIFITRIYCLKFVSHCFDSPFYCNFQKYSQKQ